MKRRSLFGGLLAGGAAVVAAKVAPTQLPTVPKDDGTETEIQRLRRDLDEATRRLDALAQPTPPLPLPVLPSSRMVVPFWSLTPTGWTRQTVTTGGANGNNIIDFPSVSRPLTLNGVYLT